ELIHLGAVHHIGHGLVRPAERDRQHAGGKRVERAGMPGLFGLEQPLDLGHSLGRAHADRLVEHHPAGNRTTFLLASAAHYSCSLSSSASRSRCTSGDLSSSLFLVKLSKLVSSRKRNSGLYFICLSAGETRPRMKRAFRFSAFTTASSSGAPSGDTKAVAILRSGDMRTTEIEITVVSTISSRTSPRWSISDRAWRTCSPTRSWRWEGPEAWERDMAVYAFRLIGSI